jgi:hypothetical protein
MQYVQELATLPRNPVHGIEKFKVDIRIRYVTDEEYQIQYNIACEQRGTPYLPIAMKLTYLLAARGIEVTDLTLERLINLPTGEQGIYVKRRKGCTDTTIIASPRLLAAWQAALNLHKITPPPNAKLLVGKGNQPVTRSALSKAWQALKETMDQRGLSHIYFINHDLKRKGISDAESDKIAGHKSNHIRAQYNTKTHTFNAPK